MSTWGQLRFALQVAAPGVPADLIDSYLNGRYSDVLESNDWTGVKYHFTLQTTAAYQSGTDTVTLTVGSATVTGVGTTWLTGLTTRAAVVGQKFYQPGDTAVYTIIGVASDVSLTLARPYEGNGGDTVGSVLPLLAYVFMQNVYPLPADLRTIVTCLDPVTGFPLTPMTKDRLDASVGPRSTVGTPEAYAIYDDSNENAPPVLHQIEIYPPSLDSRGISIEYLHAAAGFDGSDTGGSPMPWVSDTVLLYGCRADIAAYLAGQAPTPGQAGIYLAQAKLYETKYQERLDKLLLDEHAHRRTAAPVQMASRFVRHRMDRTARGLINVWRGGTPGGPD